MRSILSIGKRLLSLGLLAGLVTLSACQTFPDPASMPNGDYKDSVRHLPHAAAAPVRDLNIGIQPIPRQLAVLQNPYGSDTLTSCAAIYKETKDLEAAIETNLRRLYGPDFDRRTRAGNLGEASHEIVRAVSRSVLPYRGIVRYASGAYHRNKAGLAADRKGRERLGFLIASGRARKCPRFTRPPRPNR